MQLWIPKLYVRPVGKQGDILTKHYNFHGLFPVQANREGAKINRGDLDRMLEMEDVAEAYNIVQGADNVITINRSVDNKESRIIKFYISKSRLSQTGNAFVSETKLEQCRTHGLGLGCGSVYTKSSKEADAYAAANKIADIESLQKFSPADIMKHKKNNAVQPSEQPVASPVSLAVILQTGFLPFVRSGSVKLNSLDKCMMGVLSWVN